jgi:osmoprotectant transport system substrate-binding protein
MPQRRNVLRGACLALAVLCAACTNSGGHGSSAAGPAAGRQGAAITVGSFNFPESVLLAHIYADALAAKGFPVRVLPDLGTRELVDPALMNGLIQLVPEYAGSALGLMSLGHLPATSDAAATHRSLALSAGRRSLVAARPAPAQDNNAIVVTRATAARYHLRSIADLAGVAWRLVFGGPPECPERAYCLRGLESTYGLRFKAFAATDTGGPLTVQALVSGQIGAGLLFSTNPSIAAHDLVVLDDNRALQPAENITPLVGQKTVARYGPQLLAVLNDVSARLSTVALRSLNAELASRDPRSVADGWLRAQALIPTGQGAQ